MGESAILVVAWPLAQLNCAEDNLSRRKDVVHFAHLEEPSGPKTLIHCVRWQRRQIPSKAARPDVSAFSPQVRHNGRILRRRRSQEKATRPSSDPALISRLRTCWSGEPVRPQPTWPSPWYSWSHSPINAQPCARARVPPGRSVTRSTGDPGGHSDCGRTEQAPLEFSS